MQMPSDLATIHIVGIGGNLHHVHGFTWVGYYPVGRDHFIASGPAVSRAVAQVAQIRLKAKDVDNLINRRLLAAF